MVTLEEKKSYEALYSKIIDLSLLKHIKQNLYNITTTYNYLIFALADPSKS